MGNTTSEASDSQIVSTQQRRIAELANQMRGAGLTSQITFWTWCGWQSISEQRGCWIISADIRNYYDTVDRNQMQEFVRKRVRDRVLSTRSIVVMANLLLEEPCVRIALARVCGVPGRQRPGLPGWRQAKPGKGGNDDMR